METDNKKIYELKLFEEYIIFNNGVVTETVKRVPGGWLHFYCTPVSSTCTFIPFNNDFQ